MADENVIILDLEIDINDAQAVREAARTARLVRQQFGRAVQVNINTTQANRNLGRTNSLLGGFNGLVKGGVLALTGYTTVIFGVVAALRRLVRELTKAVQTFAEFDRVITTIGVVSKALPEDLADIEAEARRLGITTEFTASQVAQLQLVLARSGFAAGQVRLLSEAVLNLSTVTGEETTAAAGALTSVIRTFGLEASEATRVLDTLTEGFNSSRLQLDFFTTAFKFVGPIASSANVDLETVTALLGTLADRGFSASQSGTSLREILRRLIDPTSDLAKQVGFTVKSSDDLIRAFRVLNQQGVGAAETFDLVRVTAAPAFATLLDGVEAADDLREALENAEGASKEAAETIRDTLSGDLDALASAWEGLGIAVVDRFEKPVRRALGNVIEIIRELSQELDRASGKSGEVGDRINELEDEIAPSFAAGAPTSSIEELEKLSNELDVLKQAEDAGVTSLRNLEAALARLGETTQTIDPGGNALRATLNNLRKLDSNTIPIIDSLNDDLIGLVEATSLAGEDVDKFLEALAIELNTTFGVVRTNFNRFYADALAFWREYKKRGEEVIEDTGDAIIKARERIALESTIESPSLDQIDTSALRSLREDLADLEKEQINLTRELSQTREEDREGLERALKINEKATEVVEAQIDAEEFRLKVLELQIKLKNAQFKQESILADATRDEAEAQNRLNELFERREELLQKNTKEAQAEIESIDRQIDSVQRQFTNQQRQDQQKLNTNAQLIKDLQEQLALNDLELQALLRNVELRELALLLVKQTSDATDEENEKERERNRILEDRREILNSLDALNVAFGALSDQVLGNVINQLGAISEEFRQIFGNPDDNLELGDFLIAGISTARAAIEDFTQLSRNASQRRVDFIKREYDARIDAAEGFQQVQENLTQERDRRIAKERRRAAEREKRATIFSIILSGAEAVARVIGQTGVTAPFVIPLISGLVAAQLATAIATPIPEFARGGLLKRDSSGKLQGPSHASGGIRGMFAGQPFEAEGGEFMDLDEHGNLVIVNKRSSAAYSSILRKMYGKAFDGKSAMLSAINAKYGNPFDQLPKHFQQGGTIRELQTVQGFVDYELLSTAVRTGAEEGTSSGIQTVDVHRRRERKRENRTNGQLKPSNRYIFGLDKTVTTPVLPVSGGGGIT